MNVQFIRTWIAALRSGQYKRGEGVYRDKAGKYCALGVGYELCPGRQWIPFMDGQIPEDRSVASPLLMETSGLSSDQLIHIAYRLNDAGKTFEQIARHLESLLPKAAPPNWQTIATSPLIPDHVKSEDVSHV